MSLAIPISILQKKGKGITKKEVSPSLLLTRESSLRTTARKAKNARKIKITSKLLLESGNVQEIK